MHRPFLLVFSLYTLLGTAYAQFPDVPPGHYAEPAIAQLTDLGIITGFPDGLFRGQKPVNRYDLSLILTRLWRSWSTAQLSEVWQQLANLEMALGALEQRQAQAAQATEKLGRLEARLVETEDLLITVDSRTQTVPSTQTAVGEMRAELAGLQTSLTKLAQNNKGRLTKTDNRLNALETRLTTLSRSFKAFERGQTELSTAVAEELSKKQTSEPLASLTIGGGASGNDADFLVGLTARTEMGQAVVRADRNGVEAYGEATVLPALALFGRYTHHALAPQGISGVRYMAPSGVAASLYGGYDGGIVAGIELAHDGSGEAALLAGVDLSLAALTNLGGATGLGNDLLFQATTGYTFRAGSFEVTPTALFRTRLGNDAYTVYGGRLGVAFLADALTATLTARYEVASNAATSTGLPEAELNLEFTGGAFFTVALASDLPDLAGPPSFGVPSPFAVETSDLEVRAGITVSLDGLLR